MSSESPWHQGHINPTTQPLSRAQAEAQPRPRGASPMTLVREASLPLCPRQTTGAVNGYSVSAQRAAGLPIDCAVHRPSARCRSYRGALRHPHRNPEAPGSTRPSARSLDRPSDRRRSCRAALIFLCVPALRSAWVRSSPRSSCAGSWPSLGLALSKI